MGKSSKKKKSAAAGKKQASNAEFAPYTSDDGIRYSGLETPNMKKMSCSLLLPENRFVRPDVTVLEPQTVSLRLDSLFHPGEGNKQVHFEGATVLQLGVTPANGESKSMPEVITVGGKCRFTNRCFQEFSVMMRTNQKARAQGIPVNGMFEWPDIRSLQLCPVCGNMAQPGDEEEYWMLYYPMLQVTALGHFGVRTGHRLTCCECLTSLVQNFALANNEQDMADPKPMMQVLQEDTPAVAFLDAKNNSILATVPAELTAWKLYLVWETSGAWEANENFKKKILEESFGGGNTWQPNPNAKDGGQGMLVIDVDQVKEHTKQEQKEESDAAAAKDDDVKQACWTCAVELLPDDVKCCSVCEVAVYCSRACQKADWKEHKKQCSPPL